MNPLDKQLTQIQKAGKTLAYLKNEKKEMEQDGDSTVYMDELIKFWEEKLYWMNYHFQALLDGINSIQIPEGREAII